MIVTRKGLTQLSWRGKVYNAVNERVDVPDDAIDLLDAGYTLCLEADLRRVAMPSVVQAQPASPKQHQSPRKGRWR
jgi:hypothetical protein